MLNAGADRDKADGYGSTCMHLAALKSYPEMIVCLLEAGADPNKPDKGGRTPLHLDSEWGNYEAVHCLLTSTEIRLCTWPHTMAIN